MSYNELEERGTADFPVELYCVDSHHERYEMAAHWHSELEIMRVIDGELTVMLNNKAYNVKKGDIVFVNPETVHSAVPSNCTYECAVLNPEILNATNYSCKFFIESVQSCEIMISEYHSGNSELKEVADDFFEALKKKSSGYKFTAVGALYRLFGVLVDAHLYRRMSGHEITEDKNVPKLKKVLTYIRSNYDKQITLEDMAAEIGVSPKYFCYFFKSMTGRSPIEYLNKYRIESAARLLFSTDLSVTDIAYMSGFNDLSYFIKMFKRVKNVTPTKFRKE